MSVFNNSEFSEDILVKANGVVRETLACFQMISRILKIPIRKDSIEKILRDCENRGAEIDLRLIGELLSNLGLHVTSGEIPSRMAYRLQTPCVINWRKSFAIILKSSQEGILIASPIEGMINISSADYGKTFDNNINILLLEKTKETPQNIFNFNWFWPAIQKYKFVLIQVLIASFVVQLFTLGNPLLIQVIIDKVISQRSLDTLQVLGVALLFVTLLEGILGSLRTFLFAETTNRIDQKLGSEVNLKYILYFSSTTLLPSIIIAVFSLILFITSDVMLKTEFKFTSITLFKFLVIIFVTSYNLSKLRSLFSLI